MRSRIWQNKATGDLYAVVVDSYDLVLGACGPLHHTDIPHVLNGEWDSDEDDLEYVRKNATMFQDVTLQHERERDSRLLRVAE